MVDCMAGARVTQRKELSVYATRVGHGSYGHAAVHTHT